MLVNAFTLKRDGLGSVLFDVIRAERSKEGIYNPPLSDWSFICDHPRRRTVIPAYAGIHTSGIQAR